MRIKGSDTNLWFKNGKIEEETSDVIVNWLAPDLRSGPSHFYRMHQKAGFQLFDAVLNYEINIMSMKDCDSFTTIPGMLDCRVVVHCIMPMRKNEYMNCFFNICETIKTYKKNNICDSVSLYIPEKPNDCFMAIKDMLLHIGLQDVYIMYTKDVELEKLQEFYDNFEYKLSGTEKINSLLDGVLNKIGSRRVLPSFFEGWNVKKEDYERERSNDLGDGSDRGDDA